VNPLNKLVLIPLVALAIGGGVGIAAATNGGSAGDPATPPASDVKGPCDELEHATDPQCSGAVLVPEDTGTTTDQAEPGDDNGQDENDPAEVEDQNDHQGEVEDQNDHQGQDNDDQGENEQEDHSGPSANSGPGSSHDGRDDSSGDSSGSGEDGGNSGHGGGEGGDD
jgi:hypothetical protein